MPAKPSHLIIYLDCKILCYHVIIISCNQLLLFWIYFNASYRIQIRFNSKYPLLWMQDMRYDGFAGWKQRGLLEINMKLICLFSFFLHFLFLFLFLLFFLFLCFFLCWLERRSLGWISYETNLSSFLLLSHSKCHFTTWPQKATRRNKT